jgi:signal transduction histidine kinase
MSKRVFIILIVMMSIAVIGIIAVQIFWINSAMEIREKQFVTNTKSALIEASKSVQDREFRKYYKELRPIFSKFKNLEKREIREFVYQKYDTVNQALLTYKRSILQDNFSSPVKIFNSDSSENVINYRSYFYKKEKEITSLQFPNGKDIKEEKPTIKEVNIGKLSILDKMEIEDMYKEIAPRKPIYKRVSNTELRFKIRNELRKRNINTPFEFAVYDGDLPTKIRSGKFDLSTVNSSVSLFGEDNGKNKYVLYVNYPEKKNFIMSNIKRQLILATTFIIFIILAFASALYQMIKQKKISDIKTDFINNMTHEFKTPIATINLALDAIKNPKIINDKESILRYVKMIRQENKRMHSQVENVLQISKLEKNQLEISKDVVDIHDIIEDAMAHVSLIVKDRSGEITLKLEAIQTELSGSELHLTNVIVNILDNAMKYNDKDPKIEIFTENAGNFVLVKIKDNGIGMSKLVQKSIFDKFYREQKGNVHDVKGHGLGLSYVKKIVDNHHGTVYVESEKGKGSTFFIKLPII